MCAIIDDRAKEYRVVTLTQSYDTHQDQLRLFAHTIKRNDREKENGVDKLAQPYDTHQDLLKLVLHTKSKDNALIQLNDYGKQKDLMGQQL